MRKEWRVVRTFDIFSWNPKHSLRRRRYLSINSLETLLRRIKLKTHLLFRKSSKLCRSSFWTWKHSALSAYLPHETPCASWKWCLLISFLMLFKFNRWSSVVVFESFPSSKSISKGLAVKCTWKITTRVRELKIKLAVVGNPLRSKRK